MFKFPIFDIVFGMIATTLVLLMTMVMFGTVADPIDAPVKRPSKPVGIYLPSER